MKPKNLKRSISQFWLTHGLLEIISTFITSLW